MGMTVVVTRDVAERFRGFLASCMLEIAPGVYTSPRMTAAIRERAWGVLEDWFAELGGGGIVMTWREPRAIGGQEIRVLGSPPKELFEHDGIFLARRDIPAALDEAEGERRAGVGVFPPSPGTSPKEPSPSAEVPPASEAKGPAENDPERDEDKPR